MGTLGVAGPLTTSLRGLWVSGLLPPDKGGPNKRAATLEPTKRGRGPDPGLASRRESDLTAAKRGTLEPAWVLRKREGAQRPQCAKGKGPEDPGVAAPLAGAGCRGSRLRNASCVALLDRPVEDMVWPPTERCSQVSGKGICPLVS